MKATKYLDIAAELRHRIQIGEYKGRLPSVRTLSNDFEATLPTVQRAVKELVVSGLVTPRCPQGNIINLHSARRPRTGIVGVFSARVNPDVNDDVLLSSLQQEMLADKVRPLFISLEGDLSPVAPLMCRMNLDGYIFLYSSINREVANTLKEAGFAFVAASQVPDDYGINWVDFDITGFFVSALERLHAKGHRRIGICLASTKLPGKRELIAAAMEQTAKRLDLTLQIHEAPKFGIEFMEENAKFHAAFFKKSSLKPTAIILHAIAPELFHRRFPEPELMLIADSETIPPTPDCECISYSYRNMAKALWKLFQKIYTECPNEITKILLKA